MGHQGLKSRGGRAEKGESWMPSMALPPGPGQGRSSIIWSERKEKGERKTERREGGKERRANGSERMRPRKGGRKREEGGRRKGKHNLV